MIYRALHGMIYYPFLHTPQAHITREAYITWCSHTSRSAKAEHIVFPSPPPKKKKPSERENARSAIINGVAVGCNQSEGLYVINTKSCM